MQMITNEFEDNNNATSYESEDNETTEPHIPVALRAKDIPGYNDLDSELQWCQSTCEKAAHQILRTGDCDTEVNDMKERFAKTIILAKRIVFKEVLMEIRTPNKGGNRKSGGLLDHRAE